MWDFASLAPWTWLILGLLLIGLETLAPGIFLLWLGTAAILTGILDYSFGLSWQVAFVVFAGLSLASVLVGRALSRRGDAAHGASLNRRGEALVGRRFTLDRPIASGEGRIRIDDTVWRAVGPDLPAGTDVTVRALDGATLLVEPAT
jgi:membrane protein implicated in regulation of membrane protease activity